MIKFLGQKNIACTVSPNGDVNLCDTAAIQKIELLMTYDSRGHVPSHSGNVDINGKVNGKRKREIDEDNDEYPENDQKNLDTRWGLKRRMQQCCMDFGSSCGESH